LQKTAISASRHHPSRSDGFYAADALHGLIELAEMTGRSGRTGKTDLN